LKKILLTPVFIILFYGISWAQLGSFGSADARSMSMGKTYNAVSRSIFSLGINPANIAIADNNSIEFNTVLPIPFLSLGTGTNFLDLKNINYYFGKVNGQPRILNDNDKQNLNSLFKNGGLVYTNASINLFSFSYNFNENIGSFAVAMKDFVEGEFRFPHGITDLLFNGNQLNQSYNINDAEVKSWWIREYSFSYARKLINIGGSKSDKIFAGISLKYVNGFFYIRNEGINSYLQTGDNNQINVYANNRIVGAFSNNFGFSYSSDSTNQSGKASLFPIPTGTGYGFDLGLNTSLNKIWNISLSVTDIGKINWTENTTLLSYAGQYSVTDLSQADVFDTLKSKFSESRDSTGSFVTNLPTALRLGASYFLNINSSRFPGTLLFAFDFNQGLNDEPGNSLKTRVSFGTEWKPMDWIPYIRTGFSFGGLLGFHWGFGLGIDTGFLEFNIGTLDLQTLIAPNTGKNFSIALDSIWKF